MEVSLPPAPSYPPGVPLPGLPPGWTAMPPPQPPPKPGYRKDLLALVLLTALIAFHVLVNLYWLRTDNHLVALDEAHHIQRCSLYREALFAPSGGGIVSRALAALDIESPYPPLSHVLGAVCMHRFGDTPDGAALSGSIALALLLLGVYLLARQGMAPHNAFMAALVTSFTPMVYGYSRLVMPDTLAGAFVVWALLCLVRTDLFRRPGWTVFFGLTAALALLSKHTAFIYLVLPAVLFFLAGLFRALLPEKGPVGTETRERWKGVALNAALCLVIITAACSGWYLKHIDFLYTWWSTQRSPVPGIFQPGIASRLDGMLPPAPDAPEARIALDPALSLRGKPASPAEASYPFTSLAEPFRRYWQRYPLYFINDVAFLPLALVALLGAPMLFRKKNRKILLPLLAAWLGGSYLLLTGLFALNSPRFLYGIAPAAALLAVFALAAVPLLRLRRALWGLFVIVLALQFVNISVAPFGRVARMEIPLCTADADVVRRDNGGLTLYKDTINTGRYRIHPPVAGERAAERVLAAMAAHEAARSGMEKGDGAALWYQVVSPVPAPLGIDFYALRLPQAGPAPTPGEGEGEEEITGEGEREGEGEGEAEGENGKEGESEGEAEREKGKEGEGEGEEENMGKMPPAGRFAPIKGQSLRPEDTLPELAETRYVILYQPDGDDSIAKLEEAVLFFTRQGFKSLFQQAGDGDAGSAKGYIHVLARHEFADPDAVTNLFDLYDLLEQDGRNYLLSEEDRTEVEQRYAALVSQYTEVRPLSEDINLLGFHVKALIDDWSVIRLVVHVKETPKTDVRVWMRGRPREEDRGKLFDAQQAHPWLVWDFSPEPPATAWKRNQALVLTRPVMAHPLTYELEIGLFDPDKESEPRDKFSTEWVEFGASE